MSMRIAAHAVWIGFLGLWATAASAGQQDFTLHNQTGVEIYELYVSPTKAEEWEEDVLGRDTLPSGESLHIQFERQESARRWDIRVVDSEGDSLEWYDFDLSVISEITLYFSDGRAWAEFE